MKTNIIILAICAFSFLACNSNKQTSEATDEQTPHSVSYRPLFHFTPEKNWVNDPNGLVFYDGHFHLFAQYNPFADVWGHMSWLHATSSDLLSWKEQGVAIPEFKNAHGDTAAIFSGCAVVDSFNTSGFAQHGEVPLVAIYTANVVNVKQLAQNQSLAYSLDKGVTWKQYDKNPVLDIGLKDFRDPKVFWYAPKKKWIMIVSKATQYKAQFYESANLKEWKLLSEFGNIGNVHNVWECPDIFQLPVEGSTAKKWVLTLSAGHPQTDYLAMQYFIGEFDGEKFVADKLPYPLYLDYGKDYYAGITYNNMSISDGRVIMVGWANCWTYARDIPAQGYRGAYAIPRTLSLAQTSEGLRLKQQPIDELKKFETQLDKPADVTLDNTTQTLDKAKGTSLDISLNMQLANATNAGIKVLSSKDESTVISYNAAKKTIILDRINSGDTSFNKKFAGVDSVKISSASNNVQLRILIDKSIVEVFINDGAYTITDLVFPKHTASNAIELFSKSGKTIFSDIVVNKVAKTIH